MLRTQRPVARMAIATIAALAVLAASAPAGAVLGPFPPGDDDIRFFWGLTGATCGATDITTSAQNLAYENVPPGAEYYYRYYEGGHVRNEDGPYPVPATGTGTQAYAAFGFGPGTYPRTVGILTRIDVGGRPTYIGGTQISCSGPGATPVVISLEVFTPPCGVGDAPAFPDVPASSPFCLDVDWARVSGITGGYPDGGFHPTAPVTRQAMAAFLFRAAGRPPGSLCMGAAFPDVPSSHPFCTEIKWLVLEGITTGYGDGTFRPGADVSRQAMAAFLYRFAGEPRGADPSCAVAAFPDVPASHPFCGEIDWLRDEGITTGYGDGTFRPASDVSRQATAAFLHRLDGLV